MDILQQLGVGLGLASLAGVNLYLTVLLTGLAVRFNILQLADQYQSLDALSHPAVLIVAGLLFVLEFFADKIPWIDSLWDSMHTVIRPVGGVFLGLQALGEVPPYMQVVAALVAGGAALTTHSAKAGTRLLINHSPEPASNIAMSVTEDVAVVGGTALTLLNPVIALGVFSAILILLWLTFPRLWRGIKATLWLVWNKLRMPGRRQSLTQPVDIPRDVNDELKDLLLIKGAIREDEVHQAVRCLSGKSRGIRGLSPNLDGILLLTSQTEAVFFAAFKGMSARLFKIPLGGTSITVDSKFLSENLLLESPALRVVFRLPRGQGDIAESLALRVNEMQTASTDSMQTLGAESEPSASETGSAEMLIDSEVLTPENERKEPVTPLTSVH